MIGITKESRDGNCRLVQDLRMCPDSPYPISTGNNWSFYLCDNQPLYRRPWDPMSPGGGAAGQHVAGSPGSKVQISPETLCRHGS